MEDLQRRYNEARARVGELAADSSASSDEVHAALEAFGDAGAALVRELDAEKRSRELSGQTVFCCYVDVDGFRRRIRDDPAALFGDYRQQYTYLQRHFFQSRPSDGAQRPGADRVLFPRVFSDSWFVVSMDDSAESLRQISSVATGLFARFLELGFPCRGAVARGPMWWTADQPISLGPPLVDAYETADGLDVFGIALHESATGIDEAAESHEFTVPVRPRGTTARRRFTRLGAFDTFGLVSEHYVARFEGLAQSYADSPGANAHVCDRYAHSLGIVRSMLLM